MQSVCVCAVFSFVIVIVIVIVYLFVCLFVFWGVSNFRICTVRSSLRHCFVHAKCPTLAWFVCINKGHQAVESPSHVHRSSAN